MNTTFTNYAEKKAKQFLNLLQGYTKGIRITAILILLLMGVSNAWAATQRYIYVGISNEYQNNKDGSNFGLNVWGGTSEGVKSLTWIQDSYNWDGRNYTIYRAQVYDDNNKAQFKGNNNWWDPGDGYSVKLNGTTNNAIFFSHNSDGWQGQFQQNYQVTSSASLKADKTSALVGESVTLTPSLTSNTTYNTLKSTSYEISPNTGASISSNTFKATKAGTYTVTATVTYNAKDFTGITKTTSATQTIKVYDTQYVLLGSQTANDNSKGGMAGWDATNNNAYTSATINGTTMTIVATLTNAKTQYKFKIYNNFDGSYYGQTGSAEIPNNTPWTLNGSNDVKFTTTAAGSYTFIYNTTNKSIKVQYPTAYTVTFSRTPTAAADAPTSSINSGDYVLANTSVTFNAIAANTGYTWKGWYSNNTGTGNALSTNLAYTRSITANTTIFAVYTANTYTVKFDANGGTGTMSNQNFTYGTAQNLTANTFTRTGYTFAGWATSANGNKVYNDKQSVSNLSTSNGATVTLYAKWTPVNYTITYKTNGGNSIANKTYTIETATFDLPTPTKTGYTFAGWYDNAELTGNKVTQITKGSTGDKTFYAKWTPNKYTVKFNPNGGTGSMADQAFIYGTSQNLTANAFTNVGYSFNGWNTNEAGTGTKYNDQESVNNLTPTNNGIVNLYAQWTEIKHAITIKSNDNTFGTVTPSAASVGQHTAVSITATSKIDYVFKNWTATDGITITNANTATTTIKATQAGTVTANFEKAKTTTVYLKPNAAWKKDNARFAVYYWANGDKNAWSDMENIDCNNEYYAAEIPSECSGFQFVRMNGSTSTNNWENDWNQTIDLKLPTNGKTMFDMNKGKVYLKPNSEWKSDGARFAAYFFSKDGETTTLAQWMSMFDAEDGTYYCEIPAGQPQSVIFCRMDPNNQTNGWENSSVWNKTVDLQLVDADIFTIENAHFGDGNTGIATGSWNIIWTEPAYDVTLHSSAFGEYGIVYNNTKYFSPKSGSVTYQIPINATIKIFSTPYSNAYNGDVTVTKGGSTKDYASESTLTVDCNMTLDDNYKTIGTHVVYLAVPAGGLWIGTNGTNCLRALHNLHNPATDFAAGEVVKMTEAGDATIDGTSHTYYRCEIPAGYNTIRFEKRADADKWSNTDLATKKLFYEIPLNSINCYRLSGTEDNFFIGLWEPAPGFDGDYRLLHVKAAGVSYPSDVIRAGTTEQTVSLHIYKEGAGAPYPKIELQKYDKKTAGWVTTSTQKVKDISTIMNDSEKGAVWNFVVKVNDGTASVDYENVERYTGDYYIRTNNAEGGWRNYTLSTNKMTFSSYAKAHSGYTHYFCRWIDIIDNSTEPGHNNNVKFIVANDYGAVLSNEYAGDTHTTTGGLLPEDVNVRWAWDEVTNTPSRAYILGAYGANAQQNKNIVVTYNTDKEEILDDQENWIYEIDLKDINQGSQLSILQATYPSEDIQVTFKDAGVTKTETVTADQQIFASNLQMINADNDNHNTYTVRVMYDFKINKTLVMLLPNQGAKTGVDVFIERTDQGDATQVAAAVTRDEPGYTIYATMTFTQKHLESTTASEWERLYYWISFPFDVRISDVFGFGEYGKQWIIEYYDGAARAKNGYWLESDTYWKYISDTTYVAGKSNEDANGNPNNGVLVANKGYVLALARSIANQGLFKNGNEYVRLYFPSMNKIGSIDGDMQNVVTLLQEYPCTITGRKAYDSNWHMIGVPSYADKKTLTPDEPIYYYEYQAKDNTYQVTTTTAKLRDPDISSSEAKSVTFKSMHSYMVQYAGTINWRNWATTPQQLAARRNTHSEQDTYSLRLELQRNGTYADQTFVQLKDESTTDYDMNIDLTKLMNSGTNIYTLAGEQRIQLAGSVIPVAETTIPVGVKVAAAGEYTLAMPDGTDGITALLIDYETNTTTDLLLSDYTVTLPKGSTENRFALIVKPRKTATRMENIGEGAKDADKYIIDGALYLQRDGKLYNAQGQIMR